MQANELGYFDNKIRLERPRLQPLTSDFRSIQKPSLIANLFLLAGRFTRAVATANGNVSHSKLLATRFKTCTSGHAYIMTGDTRRSILPDELTKYTRPDLFEPAHDLYILIQYFLLSSIDVY